MPTYLPLSELGAKIQLASLKNFEQALNGKLGTKTNEVNVSDCAKILEHMDFSGYSRFAVNVKYPFAKDDDKGINTTLGEFLAVFSPAVIAMDNLTKFLKNETIVTEAYSPEVAVEKFAEYLVPEPVAVDEKKSDEKKSEEKKSEGK